MNQNMINMESMIRYYHSQQLRNDKGIIIMPKIPYIDHLYSVESVLQSVFAITDDIFDEQTKNDMCCVALGHDLLEDTSVSEDEISDSTNEHVLSLIKELTNPDDDDHTDRYMDQLKHASEEARLIKYADLIENTTSVIYNRYILGEDWLKWYLRIASGTKKVLDGTEFEKYPKTAELLQNMLSMDIYLLKDNIGRVVFQYPTKVVEAVTEAISDILLEETIRDTYDQFRKTFAVWRRGIMSDRELRNEFSIIISDGFNKAVDNSGLVPAHEWRRYDIWDRFLDDYHLWKNGEKPCSKKGSIWLKYREEGVPAGKKYGEEASYIDKSKYFKLMEAFHIPAELFEAAPKDVVCPDLRWGYTAFEIHIGWELWDDCCGLLSDDSSLGSTITLVDHHGLKSVIKLKEHKNADKSEQFKQEMYIGEGFIEGYTTSRPREITIYVSNGRVLSLYTIVDNDDLNYYNSFPLWKKAHEHLKKREDVENAVIDEIIHLLSAEYLKRR